MSVKGINSIKELLSTNSYPGRGIIIGQSADGKNAMIAYFIMGRSANSRNRIFERYEGGMRTKAFDESKLEDPSLIIYNPYLERGNIDIVTNGDQTDTIYDYMTEHGEDGFAFVRALHTREFEPDEPNYTPRISGVLHYSFEGKAFHYQMSILKSADGDPASCRRQFFGYEDPLAGQGHFISTYRCDGDPLPSFEGEPLQVAISASNAEILAQEMWKNLNEDNKVSLFVRYIDLTTKEAETVIINKHQEA